MRAAGPWASQRAGIISTGRGSPARSAEDRILRGPPGEPFRRRSRSPGNSGTGPESLRTGSSRNAEDGMNRPEGPYRLAPGIPLPEIAYVPGRTSRPAGTPFDESGEAGIVVLPAGGDWQRDIRHRYAIDLYHGGFFWEAHEVWEPLWRALPHLAPERLLLQAAIQLAAASLKMRMEHGAAAAALLKSAARYLEAASSHTLVRGAPVAGIDPVELALGIGAWESGGLQGSPPRIPFPR